MTVTDNEKGAICQTIASVAKKVVSHVQSEGTNIIVKIQEDGSVRAQLENSDRWQFWNKKVEFEQVIVVLLIVMGGNPSTEVHFDSFAGNQGVVHKGTLCKSKIIC